MKPSGSTQRLTRGKAIYKKKIFFSLLHFLFTAPLSSFFFFFFSSFYHRHWQSHKSFKIPTQLLTKLQIETSNGITHFSSTQLCLWIQVRVDFSHMDSMGMGCLGLLRGNFNYLLHVYVLLWRKMIETSWISMRPFCMNLSIVFDD